MCFTQISNHQYTEKTDSCKISTNEFVEFGEIIVNFIFKELE